MEIKPVEMWAVVDPQGKICGGVCYGKKNAMERFVYTVEGDFPPYHKHAWAKLEEQGYCLVPVTVAPKEDD